MVFVGWWVTGLVVIAMFIISGILVPLAVVMSDVCVVIDDFPNDMHESGRETPAMFTLNPSKIDSTSCAALGKGTS